METTENRGQPSPGTPGLSWVHEAGEALLWIRLLRVPALAARPQRVMLSLFLVVLVGFIGGIRLPWRDAESPAFLQTIMGAKLEALNVVWNGLLGLDTGAAASGFSRLISEVPTLAIRDYPVESLLLGIPILLVISVLTGAVCRSVACEFSQEITLPWTRQLGFALERWKTLLGVLILPSAVIGAVALILAAGGFVFFNIVPGLELVGGLLFGLGLLLGLAAVVLLVLVTLAWPMLVPAAVCEGTDAIDAAGRALAYVIARPIRLLVYLLVAGAVCAVVTSIAMTIADGAIAFTEGAAGAWVSPHGAAEIAGSYPTDTPLDPDGNAREIGVLGATAAWMVGFWGSCLRVAVAAYAVSMMLTAGTLIYLFMRQVCDGQHHAELWTPGQIERAFEAAMAPTGPEPELDD